MSITKSIYLIKNKVNNKVYVGQAIDPYRRFIQHKSDGKCLNRQYPINLAINKYGSNNFEMTILEKDIENYDERERYWIKYYNSISPNGYNIQEGGQIGENPLKGEKNPRTTTSNKTAALVIELLLDSNMKQAEIARSLGISERVVQSINKGETHKQTGLVYPLRPRYSKISQKAEDEIIFLLQETQWSYDAIAQTYELTKGTIRAINAGETHKRNNINYPIRKEIE